MTPQLYLEFFNNEAVARWEEWCGRKYAAANDVAYPIPPDNWHGPGDPPPELLTFFYLRAQPKASGGGVVTLDDDVMQFADTATITMGDDSTYGFDIAANALTHQNLTAEGQAAIDPRPLE